MIKIAILGPESTGKTALAKALAEYYNAPWVPEYAREYVEGLTVPYTFDDVCRIAGQQIEHEKQFKNSSTEKAEFVFFDTDLIITKVWFEYRFGSVPEFVTRWMADNKFDLYLLCAPDLPWEADPVREHGTDREFFFEWYKREIEQTEKPYVIVTGIGPDRLQNAVQAIQNQQL
ncbi:MAG: ATP-binding protein [Paludibacter sp.]|nr:ATP-binding protein [Paludibacter sp.]